MSTPSPISWPAILVLVVTASLQACTGMRPGYETPTVTVSSFRAVPSAGALPAFEIGLRVLNPNAEPLELRGVAYTVSLEGHDVIKGVGNDLPVVAGYGQGDMTLTASASLLAGMGLIRDLMRGPKETFRYELEAKLDVGSFQPAIRIKDAGEISLATYTGN